jgi:hypothetical protein
LDEDFYDLWSLSLSFSFDGPTLCNAIKATFETRGTAVPIEAVTEGHLDFGLWEQIFYGESDGGRKKRVLVKIIGE